MKFKQNYFITRLAGIGLAIGGLTALDKLNSKNYKRGYDIGHGIGFSKGHREGYDLGAKEANTSIKDIFNRED